MRHVQRLGYLYFVTWGLGKSRQRKFLIVPLQSFPDDICKQTGTGLDGFLVFPHCFDPQFENSKAMHESLKPEKRGTRHKVVFDTERDIDRYDKLVTKVSNIRLLS